MMGLTACRLRLPVVALVVFSAFLALSFFLPLVLVFFEADVSLSFRSSSLFVLECPALDPEVGAAD